MDPLQNLQQEPTRSSSESVHLTQTLTRKPLNSEGPTEPGPRVGRPHVGFHDLLLAEHLGDESVGVVLEILFSA